MTGAPEWKSVSGFPRYEVSSCGEVRFKGSLYLALPQHPRNGYLRVNLSYREGSLTRRKTVTVHKLVMLAFGKPRPSPRHEVAHKDGDKRNNHASNLVWKTRRANEKDKKAHGTQPKGGKIDPVSERTKGRARSLIHLGHNNTRIAVTLDIHRKTVAKIRAQLRKTGS